MRRKYFPLPAGLLILALFNGCRVEVDVGPFPIIESVERIQGKANYLDSIPVWSAGERIPNIILILADDLGKHDISVYDPEGVPTPALERLASLGVTFQSAYSTSAVCSPSRASLLTGRYQHRFGFERQPMNRYARNRLEYWIVDHFVNTDPMQLISPMSTPGKEEIARQGIPEGEILLSEILSRRGYRTGIFGKWHLGLNESFLPGNRGFREQFGFYEAFTAYVPPGSKGIVNHRHDIFANRYIWRQKRKGSCAIRENGKVIEDPEYLTFSIAKRACRFMEVNRDQPFFLYIPFSAPHAPFQVPVKYYDRFGNETDHNKRVYHGMVSALDDAVGMILDRLDSLGLTNSTMIVFASDNGGAAYYGATDNGPLRAGKFCQFEGGINVPMIISIPGTLSGGIRSGEPVSLMDIFTTSLDLAGVPPPGDRPLDGKNLVSLVTEGDSACHERAFFWRTDFNKTIRRGPWKLLANERDGQNFLYNLRDDPEENRNLAAEFPEKVTELRKIFKKWESETKEPLWPGVMEFRLEEDSLITLWAI